MVVMVLSMMSQVVREDHESGLISTDVQVGRQVKSDHGYGSLFPAPDGRRDLDRVQTLRKKITHPFSFLLMEH